MPYSGAGSCTPIHHMAAIWMSKNQSSSTTNCPVEILSKLSVSLHIAPVSTNDHLVIVPAPVYLYDDQFTSSHTIPDNAFLRRNISSCTQQTKKLCYLAMVHPILEYASTVWSPYTNSNIYKLEMVQRRAARFITNNYSP